MDEARIGKFPPRRPQNRIPLLLIAGSLLARDPTQNRIPLLLIAGFLLARDPTQNRIPLLLIALGC
ncbi:MULTISPECIES: hypothetical protein [Mesorhizobium]|uniref:hypothetical protein n=1 Tax=Mesorhizobium australicum TaxID=536018 RepID=UPI00333B6ABA